jgi:hypothetical protein
LLLALLALVGLAETTLVADNERVTAGATSLTIEATAPERLRF